MKYLHIIFAISTCAWTCTSNVSAQSQTPKAATLRYSNVWRPIDEAGLRLAIQTAKNNPLGLEDVMTRALLQGKAVHYLTVIQAACKSNPKNANLVAAYGWGLAMSKNSYSTAGKSVPEGLKRFNLERQFIRDTIQHARDLDSHCWLADIAETSLAFGGQLGKPTRAATLAQNAYSISQNRLTMTIYGAELRFQGMLTSKPDMIKQGVSLLARAQKLYPTYWRAQMEICFAYTNKHVRDIPKSKAAARQFLALIPPESRNLPWVNRYVDYLGIKELV